MLRCAQHDNALLRL